MEETNHIEKWLLRLIVQDILAIKNLMFVIVFRI